MKLSALKSKLFMCAFALVIANVTVQAKVVSFTKENDGITCILSINYKGRNQDMVIKYMTGAIPVLLSTKGYGLLWLNRQRLPSIQVKR